MTATVSGELSNFVGLGFDFNYLSQTPALAQMMAQRYSWLFGEYRPRPLNKGMSTNQSHASFNTSLRTPSRNGPKVTTCVTVIVRLSALQLTGFRRRGYWPAGLLSLMAILRTTNELKLRYAILTLNYSAVLLTFSDAGPQTQEHVSFKGSQGR
jgi:hypothetical protein